MKKLPVRSLSNIVKTIGAIVCLVLSAGAQGQVSLYTFSQSSGTYTPITGGTVIVNTEVDPGGNDSAVIDDYSYAAVNLPFTFTFNSTAYSSFRICSNGWIFFGASNPAHSIPLTSTDGYSGAISAFGVDLMGPQRTTGTVTNGSNMVTAVANTTLCKVGSLIRGNNIPTGTTIVSFTANTITMSNNATGTSTGTTINWTSGEIRTEIVGTSPNRTCVIQYKDMCRWATSNTGINFQIRLNEAGGAAPNQTIQFVYGNCFTGSSTDIQVGLRGNSNSDFNTRTGSNWSASTAGSANSSVMTFSGTAVPASGQTYTWTPPAQCSGAPAAGTAAAAATSFCPGNNTVLTLTGNTTGTGIGIQWDSSSNSTTWYPAAGAINPAYTTPVLYATTYYRARVTCTPSSQTATSNTVTITVNALPITVATLPFSESFESWTSACDTNDRPGASWRTIPQVGNNAWRRHDQGASGDWGNVSSYLYSPAFTAGSYSARFHSGYATSDKNGMMDLYIDLSPAGTKTILFDYINVDGSDSLYVELSTDGGATWNILGSKGTASSWTGVTATTASTAANAIIRFRAEADYGSTDIGIDKLQVLSPCTGMPTAGTAAASNTNLCPGTTTLLSLTGATFAGGINIQWDSSANGTTWYPVTGATALTYNTPVLNNTTYYRANVTCATSSQTATSNTLTLTVANPSATAATLPYSESFESWSSSCSTTDRPGVSWLTRPFTTDSAWRRNDQGSSANWGNVGSYMYSPAATAGTYSARFHSGYTSAGRRGIMDLYLNFSPAGNKFISFDYINTSGSDSLYVELSTDGGATWNVLGGKGQAGSWTGVNVTTPSTAANAILRFRAVADYGSTDIGIDNLNIIASNCFAPTANTASTTPTGASLSWTQTGTPTQWQIQHGSASFTLGTGTNVFTSSNPYALSPLTANTSYSYFVRAICGPGDTSQWSPRYVFTTPCSPATLPFSENFNTYVPSCWSEATGVLSNNSVLTGTSSAWVQDDWLNVSANGKAARINLFTTGKFDWLVSPSIDLGATPGNFVLAFDLAFLDFGTTAANVLGSDDSLAVVISTDNGATWSNTNVLRLWTAANTPFTTSNGAERIHIPLNNMSGQIKIGFYGSEGTVNDAPDVDVMVDSFAVTICNKPAVALGNDTTLCTGAALSLASGTAANYLWSTGATTQTISLSTPGTYWVKASTANPGCFATDTIVVAGGTTPVVALGNDTAICQGSSLTLNAGNPGASYNWSTGATTQTISLSTSGTYWVKATAAGTSCFATDTIVVTAVALPVVALGADASICEGDIQTLDAGNAGATYSWSTSATTQTIDVSTAGTYHVTVTNASNCVGRDTIVITVNPLPVIALGNDTAICQGTSLTLDAGNAGPGANYNWSTGVNTQTISVNSAGTYWAEVKDNAGCKASDTIAITIAPLPTAGTINTTGTSPTFNFTTTGSANVTTYSWNFGDGSGPGSGASTSHAYTANGTYTVTLTVTNDCGTATTTTAVTVSGISVGTVPVSADELKLYPNPSSGLVTISNVSALKMQRLAVLNAMGAVVMQQDNLDKAKDTIDVGSLAAGVYTVRIQTDKGVVIRQLQVLR